MILDRRAFILEHTRLQRPPHVTELKLHMADDVMPIWRMTEEALEELGLPPPFWAFAWAGGQALGRYIMDHPELVSGKRVVDLASGSGLVAIAAMAAGARSALAIDIDDFAADAIALNAAANGVVVESLIADVLDEPPPTADVILAADVFYEKPMAERVPRWLAAGRAAGALVLVGDPERSYFPKGTLVRLAEYQVPTVSALEDREIKRTCVWGFAG